MKIRTLCTTALVAVTLISTTGGMTTYAAEHELTGKGEVEFIEDTDPNGKVDPENPDKEIDPVDPEDVDENENGGAITIDRVAKLKFGTQKIDVTPADKIYAAKEIASTQTDPDGSNPVNVVRGPWVQWTDKRSGKDHTYQIKVAMTKQFTHTNDTDKLKGATVNYTNGLLNSAQPIENWPTVDIQSKTVGEDAAKQVIFDNMDSTENIGIGTWTAEFGQSADFEGKTNTRGDGKKGDADNSVFLNVPGGQSITKGTYTGEFTWTIEYTL